MKILKFKPAINEDDEPNNDFLSIVVVFLFFFAARPATELQSAMQEKLCEYEIVKRSHVRKG